MSTKTVMRLKVFELEFRKSSENEKHRHVDYLLDLKPSLWRLKQSSKLLIIPPKQIDDAQ